MEKVFAGEDFQWRGRQTLSDRVQGYSWLWDADNVDVDLWCSLAGIAWWEDAPGPVEGGFAVVPGTSMAVHVTCKDVPQETLQEKAEELAQYLVD